MSLALANYNRRMERFDVAVIGAGAAGMMCASVAGQRGRGVVLFDHAQRLAEKIRISGGGRCNFTNLHVGPEHYVSGNPHFCRSALSRFTPQDFIAMVRRHGIAFHEKHKGQLFCDDSSERIIEMLRTECENAGVQWRMPCRPIAIERSNEGFIVRSDAHDCMAERIVIATGGLSIPKIGASDFGFRIARQFGLKVIAPRPALVPLTFAAQTWAPYADLAGVALEVEIACNGAQFREDLLFTHRGLSGPAVLQVSSFWQPGDEIAIDLAPGRELGTLLVAAKRGARQTLLNTLDAHLPRRLAEAWIAAAGLAAGQRLADLPDRTLLDLGAAVQSWKLCPDGSEGYRKAEATRGGVDTSELSQSTFEARRVPGLHFIGEVVDVTGWLGGYNFQWAWSSGWAAGQAV